MTKPPLFLEAHSRALRTNLENLEFALQSGKMGTWDIDLETGKVSCSAEMLELWGVTQKEVEYDRSILQEKVHPEDVDRMREAIDLAIKHGHVYELQYRIVPRPGSQKWVTSRGRCIYSPGSERATHFSGIVFETSEIKSKQDILKLLLLLEEQLHDHNLQAALVTLDLIRFHLG